MSEAVDAGQQEFIEGREKVLIPKVDTGELDPKEFIDFFMDTLEVNFKARGIEPGSYYYTQAFAPVEDFVIPSSEQNPLVLMRYNRTGAEHAWGDQATHEILVEPEEAGGFDSFLKIDYPIGLARLIVTPANEDTLWFYSRGGFPSADSQSWFDGESRQIGDDDRQKLGRIVSDFVELVL